MAYKKADLEKQAIKAIEENNIVFIEELILYLPCSKRAVYDHKLHECNAIKNALDFNKINRKIKLRTNWEKEKASPILQLAAFKLLANDDELVRLSVKDKEVETQDQTVSFKFTEVK